MPTENEWLKYNEWKEQYGTVSCVIGSRSMISMPVGDLVHLQVGGQSIILINTHEAAFDLFEKRSSTYSDRADFIMVNELYACLSTLMM
jgi:hypothetical protein